MVSFTAALVNFVASLVVGAFGIYVGARFIADVDDYVSALITALVGSAVWFLVALFLGWIPILGPLVVLVAYLAVINARYPGGWGVAVGIAVVAWLVVLVVLAALAVVGVGSLDAIGVPGA
jgi:hypothetical protein